ncbi:MAG: phosphatase inhibitor-domain-containing protein [Monoraphidium minutum]|nr:MAG: phosphatase inhibitor-domain-containing protein [Monoraphidium minutum]
MAQQGSAGGAQAGTVTMGAPVADAVTLKLVPKRKKKKSVKWAEGIPEVDEFAGKKKSKKCCIFHKQRPFGEWSDDEDSDRECECGPDGGKQPGGGDQQPPPEPAPQP